MDKNVSGVDLDELLKAREELNRERGVETDPNMYSDYNPNRDAEEKNEPEVSDVAEAPGSSETSESSDMPEILETSENSEIPNEESAQSMESLETQENTSSASLDEGFSGAENEVEKIETSETDESISEIENSDYVENSEPNPLNEEPDELEVENISAESSPQSASSRNLEKFDIFSAFEVKENANIHSDDKVENIINDEESIERTTNIENIEEELSKSAEQENVEEVLNDIIDLFSDDEKEKQSEEEKVIEDNIDNIENAEELGALLDNILKTIDSDVLDLESEKNEENLEIKESSLASIDIEPNFEDKTSEDVNFESLKKDLMSQGSESVDASAINENEDETEETQQPETMDRLSELMKRSSELVSEVEENEESESGETVEENDESLDAKIENEISNSSEQEESSESVEEETSETESDTDESETKEESEDESSENDETSEDDESSEEETSEETSEESEQKDEKLDVGIKDIGEILGRKKDPTQDFVETTEYYDASKARPSKKPKLENGLFDDDTEIITDYNQLREILQRELKESELAAQEKMEEEDDSIKYGIIEDFKFINEIATDEFKSSDKFSYIMGKDEKGEMVYGNFREHYNLAVFGKNDMVTNSFLNSMVLSLCLKNSTSELNFVMLDSDINSTFEVYNKSSYLYFNRIAKTNKEILDTLIEVTKELDSRYEKLADDGMNNLEQFNDMAAETGTTPIPNLIVVFNNYTSASQATYIDKINTCLYQILKFGRIVGIYAVITAKLPIETNQVNYNLSSRLSFKSDKDLKYTVGVDGNHKLPDENDAIYFNINKNTTEHIKTATVTDSELDLIIKELED